MSKARGLLCTAVSCMAAWALVTAYHVEPRTAAMSGWTRRAEPNNYVSEVLTVNFDLPILAALFCGARGAGGAYHVDIYAYPGGVNPLAHGDTIDPGSYRWATCTLHIDYPDSFIKGRQVEVRWTRSEADSIEYFTAPGTSYRYGFLKKGGTEEARRV